MIRVELKDDFKELHTADSQVKEVVVERRVFLCVDGQGSTCGDGFRHAVEQLYTVVHGMRSLLKKAGRLDFETSRLEFRWMSDPQECPESECAWRLMLRIPDEVSQAEFTELRKVLVREKNLDVSLVKRVCWREGRALQLTCVGSHGAAEAIHATLRARADELGYRVKGPWHEIYINNPRRVVPGKLKRVVRLPIAWPRPRYARGSSREQPLA